MTAEPCSCCAEQRIKHVTFAGLLVNLVLAALKMIAGYFGKSQAVVADGVHSLSDSATDIAVIVGSSFWSAPPDAEHPHGHRRIETAITSVIGIALFAVAFGIGSNAVSTFFDKDETPSWLAFAAAAVSIVVKEILYRWTADVGKKVKSSAMIANAWHHRSDAISSIPASLAVIISMILPGYCFIDNIGALVVSLFVAYAAFKISWPAVQELTDKGADKDFCGQIEQTVRSVPGVIDFHKCRTRILGSGVQVDLHIQVDPEMSVRDGHEISRNVKKELLKNPDVLDVVVHLEPYEKTDPK